MPTALFLERPQNREFFVIRLMSKVDAPHARRQKIIEADSCESSSVRAVV